jgi:parallel beta-helix repeat protein
VPQHPAAFMSYVRADDEHENGRLSEFCRQLSSEVRVQTGEDFRIFQDRNDIAWGQNWAMRVEQTLDAVTLLIPIVTPNFFRSPACRAEVTRFLERERSLRRGDLILPVYYVSARELDEADALAADELAQIITSRQYADWRDHRFEPMTSPVIRKALAQLAHRLRDTFWHAPAGGVAVSAEPRPTKGAAGAESTASSSQPSNSRSASIKNDPPTRVVDAFGRADHVTISEAIRVASSGDRILVRPGLYEESLVLDKPLELLGDGPVEDIVVQAKGKSVLLFQANIGRVANLTLRQLASDEKQFGVSVTQGRLELEGCDISSRSSACVAISGGADPRLRGNRIHDGRESGVFVIDSGLGTLEDNDISGNGFAGVEIRSRANPTLRRNRIRDGRTDGVFVNHDGLGTLEDNDITDNTLSGVEIKSGGNPTVRQNRILNSGQCGVLVWSAGLGMLDDNEILGSGLSGVEVRDEANPTLRRNRIKNSKYSGVYVHDGGLGTFEENDISSNAGSGIVITAGGRPVVRRNQVNRNAATAVRILPGGGGVVEANDLTGNDRGPWAIAADSVDDVRRRDNVE